MFMAPTGGFEPLACRLGGGRSILLSYVGILGYEAYSFLPLWRPLVPFAQSSLIALGARSQLVSR